MKRSLLGAERLKKKGRVSRRASDEDGAKKTRIPQ